MDLAALAGKVEAQVVIYPDMVPGSCLLIDGDGLNYRMAGNDDTAAGLAISRLDLHIEEVRRRAGAESVEIHLTHPSSNKRGRFAIASIKPYQGNRSSSKPANWAVLREWLQSHPLATSWSDREADDGMSRRARRLLSEGRTPMIYSGDKDLRMVPGIHINWIDYSRTELSDTDYCVCGADGKMYGPAWFWHQMLQGDQVDGIPGLERAVVNGKEVKVGEKFAGKALVSATNSAEALATVSGLYRVFYGEEWADRIAEQCALLWLSVKNDDLGPPIMLKHPTIGPSLQRIKERINAPIEID